MADVPAGLNLFSDQELRRVVRETLDNADIPGDHKGAFVTVVDDKGVRAVVAAKVGDHWTVQGAVDHAWSGDLTVGATVQASW